MTFVYKNFPNDTQAVFSKRRDGHWNLEWSNGQAAVGSLWAPLRLYLFNGDFKEEANSLEEFFANHVELFI